MRNKYIEEIVIALSLSNLLFILSWRQLIYPQIDPYHLETTISHLDFFSVILNVVITAGIFVSGLWISRYFNEGKTPKSIKWIFAAIVAIALNGIRIQFFPSFIGSITLWKISLIVFSLFLILFLYIKFQAKILKYIRLLILMLSPFVVITFSQAIIGIVNSFQNEKKSDLSTSFVFSDQKNNLSARIVWIIYDELDYVLLFENRPETLHLPEFDRLKEESFNAVDATSPSSNTLKSIPALITGKKVENAVTSGKSELLLDFNEGKPAHKFSEVPNIFSEIKELKGNSAVVGWYHPYCRVIGKDLTYCKSEGYSLFDNFEIEDSADIDSKKTSFFYYIKKNLKNCLFSFPFGLRLFYAIEGTTPEEQAIQKYVNRHERMMRATLEVVGNSNINLSLIHLPVPHLPAFFNRYTGRFEGKTTYSDNLKLADIVLGQIRKKMDSQSLWNDSIVIVTSDHHFRMNNWQGELTREEIGLKNGFEDSRIPFLLKLQGQNEPFIYEKPFNTLKTKDLILKLIKYEITSAEKLKDWLDNSE